MALVAFFRDIGGAFLKKPGRPPGRREKGITPPPAAASPCRLQVGVGRPDAPI
jgi:hypothetical protein